MACWAVRAVPTENLVEVRFGGLGQGLITLIPSRQTPLMLPIVPAVSEPVAKPGAAKGTVSASSGGGGDVPLTVEI